MKPSALLVPLLAAASAYAHGFVATLTVAGKDYQGNSPAGKESPSVIRQIDTPSPVKGASNKDINCGPGAGPASLVANANPGDTIDFDWKNGDGTNWPHNTGPMLTYMASCGSTTCDKFDSTQAKWFKIQQVGGSGSTWAQANLMAGKPASITLPKNIAPGNYLIRHEIIALHIAQSPGGAEFYPSCSQLTVGGSGTGKPASNELVSFPGAYSDTDPGILVNVFNPGAIAKYQFPGPKIAAFVSGGGSASGGSTGPTYTTGGAAGPATTGGGGSSSSCTKSSGGNQKKRSHDDAGLRHYPTRFSRVMRDIGRY